MSTIDAGAYHDEILARLQPLGDPRRVEEARNDKKSGLEFLAIRVPVLRKAVCAGFSFYARSDEEVLAIWDAIWRTSAYFEVMGAALIYYENQGAQIASETWPTLSTWQERIENWAHCDSLANMYSYLLAQRTDEVYRQLRAWNVSDNQWQRRLSLVSLIHYSGKKAVFMPLAAVLPLVTNCLDDTRPYVQKAVGWVLRETGYAYPAEVRAYIEEHLASLYGIAFSAATERLEPETRTALLARRAALRSRHGL